MVSLKRVWSELRVHEYVKVVCERERVFLRLKWVSSELRPHNCVQVPLCEAVLQCILT